jgi:hypothetical protein
VGGRRAQHLFDTLQACEDVVNFRVRRRLLRNDANRSARLQHDLFYLGEPRESLLADGRQELGVGDLLLAARVLDPLAVLHQGVRLALEELV